MSRKLTEEQERLTRKAVVRAFNRPYAPKRGSASDPDESLGDEIRPVFDSYILDGRPAEFLAWMQAHHADACESPIGLMFQGLGHKYAGDYAAARGRYERAVELAAGRPHILVRLYINLSEAAFLQRNYDASFDLLDRAAEQDPEHPLCHVNYLCFASLLRDESRLWGGFRRMKQLFPEWASSSDLARGLREDGELQYLRNEVPDLWSEIESKLEASSC